MSSTNRNKNKKRNKYDYYVTPEWVIEEFLSEISQYDDKKGLYFKPDYAPLRDGKSQLLLSDLKILDPCSGGSLSHGMPYSDILYKNGAKYVTTIDIRKDSKAEFIENFLEIEIEDKYDLVITNPPYLSAQKFVEKSLEVTNPGGLVIMLLRLNFYGSIGRFNFWKDYMPLYTFTHSKRVSFTGDNNTDSTEYAHFVWQKGNYPEFTKLKVLGALGNNGKNKK